MGKIIKKIISIIFGVYAGFASAYGTFTYLELEHGINDPSKYIVLIIFVLGFLVCGCTSNGLEKLLEDMNGKKK